MGQVTDWTLASRGEVNHNWVLRTGAGKYVLRQVLSYDHYRSPRDLEFEFAYLDYLRRKSFPYQVPLTVPTTSGRLFKKIGGHYYWLYKFIEGHVMERLDRSHLAQLAKMMGSYHHIVEQSGLNNRIATSDLFNRGPILKEMRGFRSEILRRQRVSLRDRIFIEESTRLAELLRSLDDVPYRKIRRYHIHRDILPENLIWRGERLVGFIDFENVSRSRDPVVKDVAVTMQFVCRDRRTKNRLDLELAKRFLQSYMNWHPLSKKEIQLIPNLLVSGSIEDFEFAYWVLRNDPERARLNRLKQYSAIAQWSHTNRQRITSALIN